MFVILAQAYIVEKANKVLDFTVTIFLIHLFAVWYTYRLPTTLSWWMTQGGLVTVTVFAGEYFCLWLETAEIKLSVGHILERGKEIGKEAATKIINTTAEHYNKREGSGNKGKG